MTVSVLVPFRPDGGHRDAAWRWLSAWWAAEHPDWQVVVGYCPDGPWRKAVAVADALTRADGDLLVLADADVLCEGAAEAVTAVQRGAAWAIPHERVRRLSEAATRLVLTGVPWPPAEQVAGLAREHHGMAGGGMAVLSRADYEQVPIDPRFAGWGSEDEAWSRAADTLLGPHWRGTDPLVHLYHPLADRLNEHVGSQPNHALLVRYQYAAKDRRAMAALVAEARSVLV